MTMEHTGSLSEWLRKTISKLKSHLAELGYSESTILRLDATWKELIVYCEAHQTTEFTVDLERDLSGNGMVPILAIGIYLRMSAGLFICWTIIYSMGWSLSNQVSP